jgi:hypothetical protein
MAQVAVIDILATQSRPNTKSDFPVDVMMLTGRTKVTNEGIPFFGPVALGEETRYAVTPE